MRRILFTAADLPPRTGGAARYHAAAIRALGDDTCVLPVALNRHWVRLLGSIPLAMRRARAHALLVSEVLPVGTVAWTLRLLLGIPYVVLCHGIDLQYARRTPRKQRLAARALRNADRVIANSAFTARLAEGFGVPIARIRIVHPPLVITPALARPAQVPDVRRQYHLEHSTIILSVGRLILRKGFDTLISAVAQLRRTFPQAVLMIAGDGPERKRLEALARAERLAVRFLGCLDDAHLAAWYAACDCFALLPRALPDGDVEGFGMVYLEANAFGKPVIGTRSGGVPEAVSDGETGLLVRPDDPADACAAMIRILRDRALAQRLGTNGARRASMEFGGARFAATLRAALV